MYRLLLLFLLPPLLANAQYTKHIDSLFTVKDYLLDIINTVRSKQNNEKKIANLGELINLAMQSMVLYRSDLLNNFENQTEASYTVCRFPHIPSAFWQTLHRP